jgi:DNA-binding transcriptional ArsR family regulator
MSRAPDRAVADVFFALGDETRLSVVRKLGSGVPLSATALSDDYRVTRQAIAKHLQVLEGAGLVSHEKQGREVLYALESRRLEQARVFLEGISAGWDRAIERLRGMVEEPARVSTARRSPAAPRPPPAGTRSRRRASS